MPDIIGTVGIYPVTNQFDVVTQWTASAKSRPLDDTPGTALRPMTSDTNDASSNPVVSAVLVVGGFYWSFMILDRLLSVIYGFNFVPYGPDMPPGFAYWGHATNGALAAFGGFLTFKVSDYGKANGRLGLRVLPFAIFFAIGAIIPYLADAAHLVKHGAGDTLPLYIVANDLYVFLWAVLLFKVARSTTRRVVVVGALAVTFFVLHEFAYAPTFPEFSWG